jgi:iron(III) transport system substrate-binding protein
VPAGYPADYEQVITAAEREGTVVIYSTTDLAVARPLIDDFMALYPKLKVDYRDIDSAENHRRFLQETSAGTPSADVVWSSAMDLQVKLVNDGHALRYTSPEVPRLPNWAVWRDEAYGTTFEPVVVAYDKRLLAANEVPRTRAELARLLEGGNGRFKGKVTTYDLETAGLGFLVATQDARTSPSFWDVARALGKNGARLQPSTAAMLRSIASGECVLGYNLLGSYAGASARGDTIGFAYLHDYTLVVSRIAFINRQAAHPNAGRLWLDYLLSRRGQTLLAHRVGLHSLRDDIEGDDTAAALARTLGASLKPIGIGPSLMAYLDRTKRGEFLKEWARAMGLVRP